MEFMHWLSAVGTLFIFPMGLVIAAQSSPSPRRQIGLTRSYCTTPDWETIFRTSRRPYTVEEGFLFKLMEFCHASYWDVPATCPGQYRTDGHAGILMGMLAERAAVKDTCFLCRSSWFNLKMVILDSGSKMMMVLSRVPWEDVGMDARQGF